MDFLQDEIGPFRVWQWLAIIAAAIALSWAAQRFMLGRSDDGPPTDRTQGDPHAGTMATGGVALDGSSSWGGDQSDGNEARETNRQWLRDATEAVAGSGSYGHADVDTALRRYLTGRSLTDEQYAIVNEALRAEGTPPEGAPPIERERDEIERDPGPTDETSSERARWEDRVRDAYAAGPASPGQYHLTQSGTQVIERLARQLDQGDRQWSDVQRSIELQHRAARQGLTVDQFNS